MLQLQVGNVNTDIVGPITPTQWKGIEKEISFRPQNFMFTRQYNKWIYFTGGKRRMWDGWTRLGRKNKKRTYFPTGLYSLVTNHLKEQDIAYTILDCREQPEPNINLELSEEFEERDYQTKVCDDACEQQRGIIQAATGSGKTAMAAGIIKRLSVTPFLFFVTSIDLLVQARQELQKFLISNGSNLVVGQIGGGTIEIADVNVLTVQTAVRAIGKKWQKYDSDDVSDLTPIAERAEDIKELLASAKGVICDEVQHWRADMCQEIAKALQSCYYIYGISATPYRDEGDDLVIQSCFGKKVAVITASELIQQGWLMKPNIYIVNLENKKSKYRQWQSIYKEQVVESTFYNGAIANIANAYIKQGRLVLGLVQQINHGKYLSSMIEGSRFLSGKSSKKLRLESIEALRNKEIRCIISTTIFDEGIDVKPLDTLLLAGQGKSRTRAMQRVGRTLRLFEGKPNPTVIDFRLNQKYLGDHCDERIKMFETEPEFTIKHLDTSPNIK